MALSQRIESLRKQHAHLEDRIHEEFKSPAADDGTIATLKRQKLRIKDQMVQLSQQAA